MVEGPGVPVKELRELFRSLHGLCAYCRSAKAATIDHVVPISKGGKHEIGNILPACRRCNFAKHDFTLQEWINRLRGDS